jgi:hypothetical protein
MFSGSDPNEKEKSMKRHAVIALAFSVGLASLSAQSVISSSAWGLIFNTDNLLDLESYQGGIGVKIRTGENSALRGLLDVYYSNSSNTFSTALGVAYERHFKPGKFSPYWGGMIQAGYTTLTSKIDADNWTKNDSIPISGGILFGAEVFVFENISIFAEYGACLTGIIKSTTVSVTGTVTSGDPSFDLNFDTGLGNDAKLGIILYLNNPPKKAKK